MAIIIPYASVLHGLRQMQYQLQLSTFGRPTTTNNVIFILVSNYGNIVSGYDLFRYLKNKPKSILGYSNH